MKKKLIVTMCATVSALLSCGNSRLPAVASSDVILELAQKIMAHQSAPDSAGLNHFSYTYRHSNDINRNTYNGVDKFKEEIIYAYNFDLDKLVFREYSKEIHSDGTKLNEIYRFYDVNKSKMCVAKNVNNYKTYSYLEEMSKDEATQYFKNEYSKHPVIRGVIEVELGNPHILNKKVPDIIDEIKKEEPDKSKGEYCNPYYGSKDEKSLQLISDIKNYAEGKYDMVVNYSGFESTKKEAHFENDYLLYYEDTKVVDVKAKDNGYFIKERVSTTIEVDQNRSFVSLPDISRYIPENI